MKWCAFCRQPMKPPLPGVISTATARLPHSFTNRVTHLPLCELDRTTRKMLAKRPLKEHVA